MPTITNVHQPGRTAQVRVQGEIRREGNGVRIADGNSDGRLTDADLRRANIPVEGCRDADLWQTETGKVDWVPRAASAVQRTPANILKGLTPGLCIRL